MLELASNPRPLSLPRSPLVLRGGGPGHRLTLEYCGPWLNNMALPTLFIAPAAIGLSHLASRMQVLHAHHEYQRRKAHHMLVYQLSMHSTHNFQHRHSLRETIKHRHAHVGIG